MIRLPNGASYEMKEFRGRGVCAHPDCDETCGEDEHCPGCGGLICEEHDINLNVTMGNHPVDEHFEEDGW